MPKARARRGLGAVGARPPPRRPLPLGWVFLGTPPIEGSRQSFALIDECDEHIVLDEEVWEPHFSPVQHMPRPFVPPTDDDEVDWDASEEERARAFGTRSSRRWTSEAYTNHL
ncbi:MAG: hypothetical protein OXC71_00335, partial [Chloroflexi bacterium]|nr:hypothetical protein [Chloroflexota bacterium]